MSTPLAKSLETGTRQGTLDGRRRQKGYGARQAIRGEEVVAYCLSPARTDWKAMSREMAQSFKSRHMQRGMDVRRRSRHSRGTHVEGESMGRDRKVTPREVSRNFCLFSLCNYLVSIPSISLERITQSRITGIRP
jgi:hypothetical protein